MEQYSRVLELTPVVMPRQNNTTPPLVRLLDVPWNIQYLIILFFASVVSLNVEVESVLDALRFETVMPTAPVPPCLPSIVRYCVPRRLMIPAAATVPLTDAE